MAEIMKNKGALIQGNQDGCTRTIHQPPRIMKHSVLTMKISLGSDCAGWGTGTSFCCGSCDSREMERVNLLSNVNQAEIVQELPFIGQSYTGSALCLAAHRI